MIEIDNPGHAASWCKGHPEVCPSPKCPEPLNPATNATFSLLDGLFRDFTGGVVSEGVNVGVERVYEYCATPLPMYLWTRICSYVYFFCLLCPYCI